MSKSLLALPTQSGYCVKWYTGGKHERLDGSIFYYTDTYYSKSREKCELRAQELANKGFEVIGIFECIF